MDWRVRSIWNDFLPSEKNAMKQLLLGSPVVSDLNKHSYSFLQKAGWITHLATQDKLSIPLLASYIQKHELFKALTTENESIFLGNIPITAQFTKKEVRVLLLLLNRQNTAVSRERLAATIWGKDWEIDYSNWAIDQTISRLRKKLDGLAASQEIVTVRSIGFKLQAK